MRKKGTRQFIDSWIAVTVAKCTNPTTAVATPTAMPATLPSRFSSGFTDSASILTALACRSPPFPANGAPPSAPLA